MPVPAAIMIKGVLAILSEGRWKDGCEALTLTWIWSPGWTLDRKLEATPTKRLPLPWRASWSRRPRVRLQSVGSARGEDEIEYCLSRSWGSIDRKSAKVTSAEG